MDNSSKLRQGEDLPNERSSHDRYFALDDNWYFTTREGLVMGPYPSREQAVIEVRNYIHFITQAGAGVVKLLTKERATIAPDVIPPESRFEYAD